MLNGLKLKVFATAALSLLASGANPVEITGGPGGEKLPPDYTTVEPEGVRHTVDDDFAGATWVDAADLNGDGYLDVIASAWDAAEVAWWENDGTGEGWEKHGVAVGFEGAISVAAADVDNDGHTDIVGAAKMAGVVAWWRNTTAASGDCTADGGNLTDDGTSWTRFDVATDASGLFSVSAVDLNGDGRTDILSQSTDDPSRAVVWWENIDGGGTEWTEYVVEDDLPGCRFARTADLDRDGDEDIVAVAFHQKGRKVLWYENEGSGARWAKHIVVDAPEFKCFNATPADVDGDGDLDVVATNVIKDLHVIWFENDGAGGGWETHLIDAGFASPYIVSAADMDGDNDTDVIGTSNSWNTVAWWENVDGVGNAWERRILDVEFETARNPLAGDFDGDGALDVGCVAFGGTVAWWSIR